MKLATVHALILLATILVICEQHGVFAKKYKQESKGEAKSISKDNNNEIKEGNKYNEKHSRKSSEGEIKKAKQFSKKGEQPKNQNKEDKVNPNNKNKYNDNKKRDYVEKNSKVKNEQNHKQKEKVVDKKSDKITKNTRVKRDKHVEEILNGASYKPTNENSINEEQKDVEQIVDENVQEITIEELEGPLQQKEVTNKNEAKEDSEDVCNKCRQQTQQVEETQQQCVSKKIDQVDNDTQKSCKNKQSAKISLEQETISSGNEEVAVAGNDKTNTSLQYL